MVTVKRPELYHHGIKGQKWGKMNGPPYPLDYEKHSKSEKRLNARSAIDGDPTTNSKRKTLKKVAIVAGVTAAALVAGYGAYRLADLSKESIKKGKYFVSGSFDNTNNVAKSEDFILKNTNPHRGDPEHKNNCVPSAIAGFMNSLNDGNFYEAGTTGGKQISLGGAIEECFKGARVIDGSAVTFGKSVDDAKRMLLKKFGNNASGAVAIQLNDKYNIAANNAGKDKLGHAFSWVIKDGDVSFMDYNKGIKNVESYWKFIDANGKLTLARLDNAIPIEEELKKYIVKS